MDPEPGNQFHPVINVEETIGKAVGRRALPRQLDPQTSRKEDKIEWAKQWGGIPIPRGVYRFHSHEEADQWMMRKLAEAAAKNH